MQLGRVAVERLTWVMRGSRRGSEKVRPHIGQDAGLDHAGCGRCRGGGRRGTRKQGR